MKKQVYQAIDQINGQVKNLRQRKREHKKKKQIIQDLKALLLEYRFSESSSTYSKIKQKFREFYLGEDAKQDRSRVLNQEFSGTELSASGASVDYIPNGNLENLEELAKKGPSEQGGVGLQRKAPQALESLNNLKNKYQFNKFGRPADYKMVPLEIQNEIRDRFKANLEV